MSQNKLDAIEDYLLGRIAGLEGLVQRYGEGDRTKLRDTRTALLEMRHTLKRVREILRAEASGHPKRKAGK